MARKRRQPDGDKPKRIRRSRSAGDVPELPDRRAMEGAMWGFLGGLGAGADPNAPQARAQDLMYEAFEKHDSRRKTKLARQALELWPDCADAYVLLAEHARTRKEALELYQQGVAAGERALGPQCFRDDAGHFWGLLETRPYMRAREGLANALWTAGRRDEAVTHLQDMLRLNPNDNQGVRYTLAGFLLALDRDEDLQRLLEQYPEEGSALWAYTRALLGFRQKGDTAETRRLLQRAVKSNKHVVPYLLGDKFPPAEQPPYYSPGDENEALVYIGSFLSGWKATPGAVDWLREVAKPAKKKRTRGPRAQGPSSAVKERLRELPQESDVWQADFRQLPTLIRVRRETRRPWIVVVTSRTSELILAHHIATEEPTADQLWDKLADAMQRPLAGEAHRPTELQVTAREPWAALRPHLEEVGIPVTTAEELDQLDAVLEGLRHQMGANEPPGLLDMPGIGPEQVGRFYEAAAEFFRQAPWRDVGYESAVRVECAKFRGGPWYGVLMGQSGLTFGLALYEDLKLLRRLWEGDLTDEQNARLTVATTVTFGDEVEIALGDVEAARRYGWKVARPDAYPSVFRKERGMSTRPPLAWELELMEGCLRAIPDFVRRRPQDDTTREPVTVPVASGPLDLVLSWVGEPDKR
jgi:tetratricopeptide (TPR) repeat protein